MEASVGCRMRMSISECLESATQISPRRSSLQSQLSSICCSEGQKLCRQSSLNSPRRTASFSPRASGDNHSSLSATAFAKQEQTLRKPDNGLSRSIYLQDPTMWQRNHLELDFGQGVDETLLGWEDVRVRDYMRYDVVCVRHNTALKTAAKVMARLNLTGLPVVEPYEGDLTGAGRLMGVLSQRDIVWKETVPYPLADDHMQQIHHGPMMQDLQSQMQKITAKNVSDAMTSESIYVEDDATLSDVAAMMINHNVNRLPVVAPREDNKPGLTVVGIITSSDILRHSVQLT
eukprot:TRINITY_DN11850_c0_g1_i2.p1 TRINITY_DN11850_c0_g1~~TRINITY_DN11850_c0_g1_i2.p1  ORF type:complete len:289 (-),score=-3.00 TRINITY_DN11850_c0_g1_i2:128-994(-)